MGWLGGGCHFRGNVDRKIQGTLTLGSKDTPREKSWELGTARDLRRGEGGAVGGVLGGRGGARGGGADGWRM